MRDKVVKILVMAAGTGGHVFPALSIARQLQAMGVEVHWLATRSGLENELLKGVEYPVHQIAVSGLRGSGIKRKLMAPIMLVKAFRQSLEVLRQVRPDCVLGMGGFVCGPAGLAARFSGIPVVIHEQNAVVGLTNRILARFATRIFAAFPGAFENSKSVMHTGNPLRAEIIALHSEPRKEIDPYRPLNLLILGGSQGAAGINKVIPEVLANWGGQYPAIRHQTGKRGFAETEALYRSLGIELNDQCRVEPFIADMAGAYRWADLVICRAGASTVSELAAAGLPSVLVPYPYHKDRQQHRNGAWLVEGGAALLIEQQEFCARTVLPMLRDFDLHRDRLADMRNKAESLAIVDAAENIASQCIEVAHD